MWIVKLALRNPFTIAVLAAAILLIGVLSIQTMLVDIFPVIDIPVVGIIWNYPGLSAEDMERRVVFPAERGYTTSVNSISRIESDSIPGTGTIRVYFQSGVDIGAAIAQITASSLVTLRIMPPAITPPTIIQYNASNLPVSQLTITSDTIPEEKLFDYALNFVRLSLFTVPGLSTPAPYGGKFRQINVDVDPAKLFARGLSAQDVVNTLNESNLIIPAGTARIGAIDYNVVLNSSPSQVEDFKNIPVKVVDGRPVTLGDIAVVQDAFADQTNIVRINGKRAVYLNILRKSDASTLKVVDATREKIPFIQSTAPKGMNIKVDFDQSRFVRAAVDSVLREGVIAAVLVSLMVLIFLKSWRSVFIVCTSIPLSILASIIGLKITGNSLNIMTLGGLSLAIGMLVDDATVEIENIHRNMVSASSPTIAILRGASQVALPAIVSTFAICIVFFPIGLLTGPAKFLFTPLAYSVVFAMLASYVLSRTLVPTLARKLMSHQEHKETQGKGFEKFKKKYTELLEQLLHHRKSAMALFTVFLGVSAILPLFVIGSDFFPTTDTGLMRIHFRGPIGMRIEETEKLIEGAEETIRKIVPADQLETVNSTIGVPLFYNLAFVRTDNVGDMDAEILIALKEKHSPTLGYQKKIREALREEFPGSQIFFQSADIVSQVLNFGVTAPLDIQIQSVDVNVAYGFAKDLRDELGKIPGAVDVNIKQIFDYPTLKLDVDRIRAGMMGMTQRDVANSMLITLASSSLIAPSFFLNPENNVNYFVVAKAPLFKIASVDQLLGSPVTSPSAGNILQSAGQAPPSMIPSAPAETLGNLAKLSTLTTLDEISHKDVQRIVDVTANVEGRDLGSVVKEIQKKIDGLGKLPAGTLISIVGQNEVMKESFTKLALGMILAIILVYMLMVVLFQSWIDPFIIMGAVPGALIGIVWMLALSGTTLNVVSLMGSIMAIGIAVSNSILLVSFANETRIENPSLTPLEAALEAGKTRLRPVIMTALAMILGMLPMALGVGEAGEQNAPLGRAVIGGLFFATITTLLIVPLLYSILRKGPPTKHEIQAAFKKESRQFDKEQAEILHET